MNGSEYLAYNAQTMKRILLGELNQMTIRFKLDETIYDYLRSIKGKTAELFWLACKEGAYFGGCDVQTVRLAGRIGRNIGFAFQIYDDILDYTADQDKLKKPVLEDLGQGIYTLPLLLAKQQNPEALIPYLCKQSAITPDEITEVAKLVVQLGVVEQAKQMAQAFTQKALIDIEKLPNVNIYNLKAINISSDNATLFMFALAGISDYSTTETKIKQARYYNFEDISFYNLSDVKQEISMFYDSTSKDMYSTEINPKVLIKNVGFTTSISKTGILSNATIIKYSEELL